MKSWPVQDAKARFSELLETCIAQGPQVVTKRGAEAAVLVSIEEWRRAKAGQGKTIKDVLMADHPRVNDLMIPPRGQVRYRRLVDLED